MIRVSDGSPWAEELGRTRAATRSAPAEDLAFVTLWCAGPRPGRDALLRVQALRSGANGTWRAFDGYCRSEDPIEASAGSSLGARILEDFGVLASDLVEARPAEQVVDELRTFLAGASVIASSREAFLAWWYTQPAAPAIRATDLAEIAALCMPGRLSLESEGVVAELLGRPPERGARALEPADLRAAFGILTARLLACGAPALALLRHACLESANALARSGTSRGGDVERILGWVDVPSYWRAPERALEPESPWLQDGLLTSSVAEFPDLEAVLGVVEPRWKTPSSAAGELPRARLEEERTLNEVDRRHVDEIFQEHLPRHFGGEDPGRAYRLGQHGVASVIAEAFGRRELRLVHAPTGTGKTLAYLVPVALWAFRNHARVGIATFTRVLQEQAMTGEAPLALALLAAAANARGIRVSVLKGRENYLCWRALTLQQRSGAAPLEEVLAWNSLVLFALHDENGDLDRLPRRPPLAGLDADAYRRALERLVRTVRSETGCCTYAEDRATCAAEAAWRTAERAHVVITNHALALARRDFFHHLVFDECEHLHEVAQSAFSHAPALRDVSEVLERLDGRDGRHPLERVVTLSPDGSEARNQALTAIDSVADARAAVASLARECARFKEWRARLGRERMESDGHSLFREYALEHGGDLLVSHAELTASMARLGVALALLQESLDGTLPQREVRRLRRALEMGRVEVDELCASVGAWIPRDSAGRPAFGHESFHDLETTPAGHDVLATRVLLPHEHLGRHYYPSLAGAVLLSATTWLRGGFAAAEAYLGLARAAEPAPEEERDPFPVQSFRAPEAFDYARVLVAVPRDAPPVGEREAYLAYVSRFIAFLAERTRGRLLALFTNAEDLAWVGSRLEPFFEARRLPFWWQRMRGTSKEELGRLFRARVDSVLLGLDAFWYGADFPGSTLEYLVIVRLPFGVPDRYHHAQCAALGAGEQRRTIYLPRALAKFRQGFGRLMRKESDRGCVFVLDRRILDPRHRDFLRELPLRSGREQLADGQGEEEIRMARLVQGESERCLQEALAHMGMLTEVRRQGLSGSFASWEPDAGGPRG